ncbi:MAG: hypothetical protein AB7F28_04500 [Candidatus Margulisiibacteriota bacterium]
MSIAFKLIAGVRVGVLPMGWDDASVISLSDSLRSHGPYSGFTTRVFAEDSLLRREYLGLVAEKYPAELFDRRETKGAEKWDLKQFLATVEKDPYQALTRLIHHMVNSILKRDEYSKLLVELGTRDSINVKKFVKDFAEACPLFPKSVFSEYNLGPSLHQVWHHVSDSNSNHFVLLFCNPPVFDANTAFLMVQRLLENPLVPFATDAEFYVALLQVCTQGSADQLASFLEKTKDIVVSQSGASAGTEVVVSPGADSDSRDLSSTIESSSAPPAGSLNRLQKNGKTLSVLTVLCDLIKTNQMTDQDKIGAVLMFLLKECTVSPLAKPFFARTGPLFNRIPLDQFVSVFLESGHSARQPELALFAQLPDRNFSTIFTRDAVQAFKVRHPEIFNALVQRQIDAERRLILASEFPNHCDFELQFPNGTARLDRTILFGQRLLEFQERHEKLQAEAQKLNGGLLHLSILMSQAARKVFDVRRELLHVDVTEQDTTRLQSVLTAFEAAKFAYESSAKDIRDAKSELLRLERAIELICTKMDSDAFLANPLFQALVRLDENLQPIFGIPEAEALVSVASEQAAGALHRDAPPSPPAVAATVAAAAPADGDATSQTSSEPSLQSDSAHGQVVSERFRNLQLLLRNICFETSTDFLMRLARVLVDAGYSVNDLTDYAGVLSGDKICVCMGLLERNRKLKGDIDSLINQIQRLEKEIAQYDLETSLLAQLLPLREHVGKLSDSEGYMTRDNVDGLNRQFSELKVPDKYIASSTTKNIDLSNKSESELIELLGQLVVQKEALDKLKLAQSPRDASYSDIWQVTQGLILGLWMRIPQSQVQAAAATLPAMGVHPPLNQLPKSAAVARAAVAAATAAAAAARR